jgi:hypothetical protein
LKPLEAIFLPAVFVQGVISTMFFGWLPLYLPEIFPTRVRATGTGISYNSEYQDYQWTAQVVGYAGEAL